MEDIVMRRKITTIILSLIIFCLPLLILTGCGNEGAYIKVNGIKREYKLGDELELTNAKVLRLYQTKPAVPTRHKEEDIL